MQFKYKDIIDNTTQLWYGLGKSAYIPPVRTKTTFYLYMHEILVLFCFEMKKSKKIEEITKHDNTLGRVPNVNFSYVLCKTT